MFSRTLIAALLALPIFAAASHTPSYQCNTGDIQCCNSVQSTDNLSTEVAQYLSDVNVDVGSLTGVVGVTCSAITVVGASSNSCTAQPVCCTNTGYNGVVATGCTPANVGI